MTLQGYKQSATTTDDIDLGAINHAFPGNKFPIGMVHEFICSNKESLASTIGFIAGIQEKLLKKKGVMIWIDTNDEIFPPALASLGIDPEQVIFIYPKKEKDILWTIEECLKCEGIAAVVTTIRELSFKASRRLQLVVEQSGVTGFVIRNQTKSINTTACVTRWEISSLPSELFEDMPGVGFPKWNVILSKVRNGKPGSWQIQCKNGKWIYDSLEPVFKIIPQKKTG